MKYLDWVKVTVEKEKYAKYGIHKGMYGWICDEEKYQDGAWLVDFPQGGAKDDIMFTGILESDMVEAPDARISVTELIKRQWDIRENKVQTGPEIGYLDCVEVTAERDSYAQKGIHKGMRGIVWSEKCSKLVEGWYVLFPLYENDYVKNPEVVIAEGDMRKIPEEADRVKQWILAQKAT
ncbi:MAG: hypothetical protein KIG36_07095 [Eubacteriales bacterium]|nr:hypothetical protein [Eubacteriales bacterium]